MDCRGDFADRKSLYHFNKGSDHDRLKFISDNVTAGVLLAKDARTVEFFGLPQHNTNTDVFLGTTSFTYDDSPYTTKARINGCFYHLFKDEEVDNATFPFPFGESFKAEDIANVNIPNINAGGVFTKSISYRIARIPIALPIPFGQKYIKKGEANQDFMDLLEEMSTDKDRAPLWWHKAVSEFNAGQHEVIADPDNKEKLKDRLPEGSDDSPVDKNTSPYVSVEPWNTGDGENKQLLESLKKRLTTLHVESDKYIDPIVKKILRILNLSEETNQYLKKTYPTIKKLLDFFLHTTDEFKAMKKPNGRNGLIKEPLFKASDVEAFIIFCRWTEKEETEEKNGDVDWGKFTKRSFNQFRKDAPKTHLDEIFDELCIDEEVKNTLKGKVQTPSQLFQKAESLYKNNKKVGGGDLGTIKKFKDWYSFHSIGYLPSDWIISFRAFKNHHPKELELRKVLSQVGLQHDAIRALNMNDVKDVSALIERTENWKTVNKYKGGGTKTPAQAQENDWKEWEKMGLTRSDAIDIINFRHWYTFCVERKADMKDWAKRFSSTNFRNFIQRYGSGDNFKKPSKWKTSNVGKLKLSQEEVDFDDMLQKAAEAGSVTEEQRYHLLQHIKKREKIDLITEIVNEREEGTGETSQKEDKLGKMLQRDLEEDDEEGKEDLLFYQRFCQFFFSALLVLVLLGAWTMTTIYLMKEHKAPTPTNSGDSGEDNDLQYIVFIQ